MKVVPSTSISARRITPPRTRSFQNNKNHHFPCGCDRLTSSGRSVAFMTLLLFGNMMLLFLYSTSSNCALNNASNQYNYYDSFHSTANNSMGDDHMVGSTSVVEQLGHFQNDGRPVIPEGGGANNDNNVDDYYDDDNSTPQAESAMTDMIARMERKNQINNTKTTRNSINSPADDDGDEQDHYGLSIDNDNDNDNDSTDFQTEPLNYLRHPIEVTKVFQECTADPDCYFTYHHVSKTGGTTIEQAFFPFFHQPVVSTCCHGSILAKFRDNPQKYCAQKFTSWQASFRKFMEIVDTCREIRPRPSRTVVWVTFREPLSTLVSLIHQMCNKNAAKRDERIRRACEICAYTNETADVFGRQLAQSVEWQLKGAYRTSHRYLSETNVTTVVMEPADLNDFWTAYYWATTAAEETDSERNLAAASAFLKHSNAEKISTCSFQPTTELIKAMSLAQNIYRRMVGGTVVPFDMLDVNGIVGGRVSDKDLTKFKKNKKKINPEERGLIANTL